MSQSIGLLTAGAEVMPNQASRIARGLRSISLNLQGFTDEGEKNLELIPKMEEDFKKLGITLYGTDGQLKSTFDIFKDLSEVYPTLDQNTRTYYSALIGGKTQVDVVNSILLNFNSALEANETAINSAGSAMRENARYAESLEFAMNNLKAQFQDLSLNVINSQFIKSIINAGTAVLKFANSDIGQVLIKAGLVTVALTGFMVVMGKLKVLLMATAGWQAFNTALTTFTLNTTATTRAVSALTAVLKINPLFFGATIVIGALTAINKSYKELIQSLEDSVGIYTETFDTIKKGIDSSKESFEENLASVNANEKQAKNYLETIKRLEGQTNKTALEQMQFKNAVDGLNSLFPELNLQIDATTGLLNQELSSVEGLITGYINLAKAKAYSNLISESEANIAKIEVREQSVQQQIEILRPEVITLQQKSQKFGFEGLKSAGQAIIKQPTLEKYVKEQKKLNDELDILKKDQSAYEEKYIEFSKNTDKFLEKLPTGGSSGGGSKSKKKTKKEVDALKLLHEANQLIISDMEHQLFLAEKQGVPQEQQIKMIQAIQAELHKQAEYYRKILPSAKEEDKKALQSYIQDAQKNWWEYAGQVEDINKKIADDAKKAYEDSLKAQEDALNAQLDIFDAQMKALERYAKQQQEAIQEEIDVIDKEIQMLEKANEEREKAIQLQELEENLARAKQMRVRIYEEGKGFVYREDVGAISEAQTEIDEFKAEQAHQAQIDSLNAEKEALQQQKDEWANYVTDLKEQQDILMNNIKLGMEEEKFINDQKLSNLNSFADAYMATINRIIDAQQQLNSISSGGTTKSKSSGGSGGSGKASLEERRKDAQKTESLANDSKKNTTTKKYAIGTHSIPFNQWANVNEQGDELFIPPKGNMQYLQKGTGIVPKTLTENLMEIGKLGVEGFKNFTKGGQSAIVHNNFDKLVLPNVTDTDSFIKELKSLQNFKNIALQSAFTR